MKHTKQKIIAFTLSIMLLSICIVMLSFNLMMQGYIKNQAVKTLQNAMELYQPGDEQEVESDEYELDSVAPIQVDTIYLDDQKEEIAQDYYFSKQEKKIIDYCNTAHFQEGEIRFVSLQNEDFYITKLYVKDRYDDEWQISKDEVIVLFVNVSPLKLFARSMNMVFFTVFMTFTLLAGYFGVRLGRQIEGSEEKLKQFFQNVSHELKTPIMSIQGYAEGLQAGIIKDNVKATQIIMDESKRMSALVEELLYLSKIDSGQLVLKKEPIYINELLYDCLRMLAMIAEKKEIEIQIQFEEVSAVIYGDEKQLAKAFNNIIINALQYAKGQVRMQCATYKKYVEISICDDGDGISEDDLLHVFERFYTGIKGNTGIGLALTKEIIEAHGGEIAAKNSNTGAVFHTILPIK